MKVGVCEGVRSEFEGGMEGIKVGGSESGSV